MLGTWCLIAAVIFVLSVGFAGGLAEVFLVPRNSDWLSFALWAIGWIFVIAPFPLLLIHLIRK